MDGEVEVVGGARAARIRIGGAHAGHPRAEELARAAHALLHRYATEVVLAHRLCPFLHNVDTGMGAVCVMLDTEPDLAATTAMIAETGAQVLHVVFPLVRGQAPPFERFGNKVAETLRKTLPEPLVHATFHPEMVGGRENSHRMVGLLRRAPDPFIQLIPPGMQSGGTVLAGEALPDAAHGKTTYQRLQVEGVFEGVQALLDELHHARQVGYAALADEVSASVSPP